MISALLSFILKGLYSKLRIRFYLIEVSWNNWSMQNVSLETTLPEVRVERGGSQTSNCVWKKQLGTGAPAIGKPGKTGCRDVSIGKFVVRPLRCCEESAPTGWNRVKVSENLGVTRSFRSPLWIHPWVGNWLVGKTNYEDRQDGQDRVLT